MTESQPVSSYGNLAAGNDIPDSAEGVGHSSPGLHGGTVEADKASGMISSHLGAGSCGME